MALAPVDSRKEDHGQQSEVSATDAPPKDVAHLRTRLSNLISSDELDMMMEEVGVPRGRFPPPGTMEVRCHGAIAILVRHGTGGLTALLELACERASELRKDPVVQRYLGAGELNVQRYLSATREEHHLLPVAGYETEVKVPIALSEVYVSLRARVHRVHSTDAPCWGTHDQTVEEARSHRHGGGEEFFAEQAVKLEEAFVLARSTKPGGREMRGIVVVGDPGCGKTTLLKRMLVKCIDEGASGLGLPEGLVPVLLPLRDLKEPARGLDHFLQNQLATNPHLTLANDFGTALLRRGKLLILLDGLDEVANEASRVQVRQWIESAYTAMPDCWFAVTSRHAGYQGKARFDNFIELNVQPFDDAQAQRFIRQWYDAVEVGMRGDTQHARAQARQQSERLWRGLTIDEFRSRRLRELISNPLLLTILCLVHRVRGSLPKRRGLLYRECVNVLLQHWQQAKELELEVEGEQARQALQPVAWWLHQEEKRTKATSAELTPVLEGPLARLQLNMTPKQFLTQIRDRSGLLVGWDVDSFGFMHLSLQEYLVALEAWTEDLIDEVVSRFGESWWKEVTLQLLAISEKPVFERFMRALVKTDAFVAHPELVSLCIDESFVVSATPFIELLDDRPRPAKGWLPKLLEFLGAQPARRNESTWQRDYAALQALKNMKDERIVPVCQRLQKESPHKQVKDLARELLAARRVTLAKSLEAGDPWVHEATGLEFVYVPRGSFMMGGDGRYDGKPIHEVTFAHGFWIGKYPVTNAQYERFMKRGGGQEPRLWKNSQWNAPEQPVVEVTWDDALAYCRWASEVLLEGDEQPPGGTSGILLPSEAEWEYAARGPENRKYPWGNKEPTPKLANFGESKIGRTTPVGQYPDGASWVGALDMAGNVLEWCVDHWHDNYEDAPADGTPWMKDGVVPAGLGDLENDPIKWRVFRGGGWDFGAGWVRSAYRGRWHSRGWYQFLGFRVLLAAISHVP